MTGCIVSLISNLLRICPWSKAGLWFPIPIWSHAIYIIWQLRRNPPLPSNAVAKAFVETIQTLQLICEAWWELRALKMQNRKNDSWRDSHPIFSALFSCLSSHPLFFPCSQLTFPKHFIEYKFCISMRLLRHSRREGQRQDKYETQMRSKCIICNSDEMN